MAAEGSLLTTARTYRERRSGDPAEDIALFALLLRQVGVTVPTTAVLRAVRAVALVALDRQEDVRAALLCCLTSGAGEGRAFDIVFPVFWAAQAPLLAELSEDSGSAEGDDGREQDVEGTQVGRSGGGARIAEGSARRATYSPSGKAEQTAPSVHGDGRRTDELARRLARALGTSRGHRTRTADEGDRIDLRDSLRHNLGPGEELLTLRRIQQRPDRARLVVLCDVSSSMQPFTPLFLRFVHSLTKMVRTIESAIFNVEVAFVTDVFRRHALPDALRWLSARSISLAGGTRIGHCIHAFGSELDGRGVLRPGTTALILSDGWDVGDAELLQRSMRRLRAQVGRLVWLDPHAAAAGYQPQVRGLRIARPFVDDYLDCSSLDSLTELVARVERGPRP